MKASKWDKGYRLIKKKLRFLIKKKKTRKIRLKFLSFGLILS